MLGLDDKLSRAYKGSDFVFLDATSPFGSQGVQRVTEEINTTVYSYRYDTPVVNTFTPETYTFAPFTVSVFGQISAFWRRPQGAQPIPSRQLTAQQQEQLQNLQARLAAANEFVRKQSEALQTARSAAQAALQAVEIGRAHV